MQTNPYTAKASDVQKEAYASHDATKHSKQTEGAAKTKPTGLSRPPKPPHPKNENTVHRVGASGKNKPKKKPREKGGGWFDLCLEKKSASRIKFVCVTRRILYATQVVVFVLM